MACRSHLVRDLEELQVAEELLHVAEPGAGLFTLGHLGVLQEAHG